MGVLSFSSTSTMSNVKDLIEHYEALSPQPQQEGAVAAPPPAPASVGSEILRSDRGPSTISTSDRQDSAR